MGPLVSMDMADNWIATIIDWHGARPVSLKFNQVSGEDLLFSADDIQMDMKQARLFRDEVSWIDNESMDRVFIDIGS